MLSTHEERKGDNNNNNNDDDDDYEPKAEKYRKYLLLKIDCLFSIYYNV